MGMFLKLESATAKDFKIDVSFAVIDSYHKLTNRKTILMEDCKNFCNFSRGFPIYLKHEELFDAFERFVPNNILTIYCEVIIVYRISRNGFKLS